jgi:hypothetical protein
MLFSSKLHPYRKLQIYTSFTRTLNHFVTSHNLCNKPQLKFSNKPGTVAHTCNLSFLGGCNQEDGNLRPAWANSSWDPISQMDCRCGSSGRESALQGPNPEFKSHSHLKNKSDRSLHKTAIFFVWNNGFHYIFTPAHNTFQSYSPPPLTSLFCCHHPSKNSPPFTLMSFCLHFHLYLVIQKQGLPM